MNQNKVQGSMYFWAPRIQGPKPIGPEPKKFEKFRTRLDKDQQILKTSTQTRTNKIFEISDQVRPVGHRTWRLVDPWAPLYIYGVYRNIAVRVPNYYVPI